jgi:hypothetical protein
MIIPKKEAGIKKNNENFAKIGVWHDCGLFSSEKIGVCFEMLWNAISLRPVM